MFKYLAANWKDIGYLVGIVALATYTFWKEMRQRKLRVKYKVAPNPKECGLHAVAIGKLETEIANIKRDIDAIKTDIRHIRQERGV